MCDNGEQRKDGGGSVTSPYSAHKHFLGETGQRLSPLRATEMGAVLHYLCCSAHMSKTFLQLQDLMYPTITMHPEP